MDTFVKGENEMWKIPAKERIETRIVTASAVKRVLDFRFAFIGKEDFGPLSNSPVIFLLSPGRMLLMMFLFQKWLGSPFPEDV